MRLDSNIAVTDARLGTNAPFTPGSTLSISGKTCPASLFISLRVHCDESTSPPVSITRIERVIGRGWHLWLSDARGLDIGYFALPAMCPSGTGVWTRLILSSDGVVKGHVSFDRAALPIFSGLLDTVSGTLRVGYAAFTLLPFCLVPCLRRPASAFMAGGTSTTSNIVLIPLKGVHISETDGVGRLDVGRPLTDSAAANGFRWLQINNAKWEDTGDAFPSVGSDDRLWIGGCDLVLKHGITSNLRVLNTSGVISLEGVLDG